jgi:hypothetical protein
MFYRGHDVLQLGESCRSPAGMGESERCEWAPPAPSASTGRKVKSLAPGGSLPEGLFGGREATWRFTTICGGRQGAASSAQTSRACRIHVTSADHRRRQRPAKRPFASTDVMYSKSLSGLCGTLSSSTDQRPSMSESRKRNDHPEFTCATFEQFCENAPVTGCSRLSSLG